MAASASSTRDDAPPAPPETAPAAKSTNASVSVISTRCTMPPWIGPSGRLRGARSFAGTYPDRASTRHSIHSDRLRQTAFRAVNGARSSARSLHLVGGGGRGPGASRSCGPVLRVPQTAVMRVVIAVAGPASLEPAPGVTMTRIFSDDSTRRNSRHEGVSSDERAQWFSSDEPFRAIVENVGEGVGIVDEHEEFVFVNDAGAEILGVPADELVGMTLRDFVSEEDWARVTSESELRRSGERSVYELTFHRPDGKRREVIVTASPSYDVEGRYRGTYGVFRDISQRKAMEELVNRRSRDLAERVKELQCLYSVMEQLHTHKRNPVEIARSVVDLVPSGWTYPEFACARIQLDDDVFTSKGFEPSKWRMSADLTIHGEKSGAVEVHYKERPDGAEPFQREERYLLDAIAEQLSRAVEHASAERALMKSRETAQTLIDNFPGGAVLLDGDLRVVAANMPAANMTKREPSALVGSHVRELFRRELAEKRIKDLRRVADTGEQVEQEERQGDRVYSTRIFPVFGRSGSVDRLAVFTRDVTEEKRRERVVRRSEAKYRSMFELSPEAIVLLNKKGNVLDVNGRIEDWLGYPRDEIVGRNILFLPFVPKETKGRLMKRFLERMAGRSIQPYDVTFVTKNGSERVGRIHGAVLTDDEGNATQDLVMISDITEQKHAELAAVEAGRKLEELHGVVKRLAACQELDEVYPLITEAARSILSIDACGFFVERDGYLSLAATCCRGREGSPEPVRIEDAGHLGEAYVTGSMQL
ncbi:MAG: PAS domain S-box protein, partial [Candidatus Eisenbacteria bacterium]|nr:PAS domain S-box protein [Candidatus Eisenbacteria bacterium]